MQFLNRQSQTISDVEIQRPISENSGMGRITSLPQKRKSQLRVPNLPNRCAYIQHCESPLRINIEIFAGQSLAHTGYLNVSLRLVKILQPVCRQKPLPGS